MSGTVLSFELGLLWPRFMGTFGESIGLPFALEGFAFFTEAIFLGIYLYGRGKVSPGLHLASGIAVAVSGAASALFVTLVSAFMNGPRRHRSDRRDGEPVVAVPGRARAAVLLPGDRVGDGRRSRGFILLRNPTRTLHRKALALALPMACLTALVQPLSGDRSAKHLAVAQPLKLAAAEAHLHTGAHAALHVGGIPDLETGEFHGALPIPGGLSFLAFGDLDATVTGLDAFPRDDWPPVLRVRTAFQVMVGAGSAMALAAIAMLVVAMRRRRLPDARRWLLAFVRAGPARLRRLEAGWLVTEWGRQPWIVRGLMRTADAVTRLPLQGGAVLAVHDRLRLPGRRRGLPAGEADRAAPTSLTNAARARRHVA